MPTFDLALPHRMIGTATGVAHAVLVEPVPFSSAETYEGPLPDNGRGRCLTSAVSSPLLSSARLSVSLNSFVVMPLHTFQASDHTQIRDLEAWIRATRDTERPPLVRGKIENGPPKKPV